MINAPMHPSVPLISEFSSQGFFSEISCSLAHVIPLICGWEHQLVAILWWFIHSPIPAHNSCSVLPLSCSLTPEISCFPNRVIPPSSWSVVGSISWWLSSRISPYQIMGAIYQRQVTSRVGNKTSQSSNSNSSALPLPIFTASIARMWVCCTCMHFCMVCVSCLSCIDMVSGTE